MPQPVSAASVTTLRHHIHGKAVASLGPDTIPVTDPYHRLVHSVQPAGDARDVDAAVAAAREAIPSWVSLAPSQRKKVLLRWADRITDKSADLDAIDAEDMGKPISLAAFNAKSAAELVRFNAEALDKVFGDTLPSGRQSLVLQRWVPHGVVAAITPWNFPTFNAVLKMAPALAAGNTLVVKPSEISPRSALMLAELAMDAGVPAGVINIVLGRGDVVGKSLCLHTQTDMVTFTGSSAVGRLVVGYAAQADMKPVVAECGGKSPHVVMDDGVDLDMIASLIAATITTNQGQWCCVGSRVIVADAIADRLVEKISACFDRVVPGDPRLQGTTFGPLASRTQHDRVATYLEDARAAGAQVISARSDGFADDGDFIAPAIVIARSPQDRIVQEEVFGPVLTVLRFSDLAEAIRLANDTPFGLLAYVWTTDIGTGMTLSQAIRSSVLINAAPPSGEGAGHGFTSEPVGASGVGMEGGVAGLKSYMRRQTVWFNF